MDEKQTDPYRSPTEIDVPPKPAGLLSPRNIMLLLFGLAVGGGFAAMTLWNSTVVEEFSDEGRRPVEDFDDISGYVSEDYTSAMPPEGQPVEAPAGDSE